MREMRMKLEDYLTIKQVAKILNRTHTSVWKWCVNGRIKSERIGNQYLIKPDDVILPEPMKPGPQRKTEWDE